MTPALLMGLALAILLAGWMRRPRLPAGWTALDLGDGERRWEVWDQDCRLRGCGTTEAEAVRDAVEGQHA